MKAPSPLLGFNNNVRHKGRMFHIQTEDSGLRHPHVITHLFADGGRILKTTKTSYAEFVGQDRLAETVRAMMQEQHKAMFIALRDGKFDHVFEEGAGASSGTNFTPSSRPPEAQSLPSAPPTSMAFAVPPIAEGPTSVAVVPPPIHGAPSPVPRVVTPDALPPTAAAAQVTHGRAVSPTATTVADQPVIPPIDLDLDALERAAAEAQTPFIQQIQDLPPPPAAVLGAKRSGGSYSVRSPPVVLQQEASRKGASETSPRRPSAPPPPMSAPRGPGEGSRYAPSRPASIFATTRPQEGTSIFGEDLISEKSLDEVILGYLAEDLDPPTNKK